MMEPGISSCSKGTGRANYEQGPLRCHRALTAIGLYWQRRLPCSFPIHYIWLAPAGGANDVASNVVVGTHRQAQRGTMSNTPQMPAGSNPAPIARPHFLGLMPAARATNSYTPPSPFSLDAAASWLRLLTTSLIICGFLDGVLTRRRCLTGSRSAW